MNKKGDLPGPIENKGVALRINNLRKKNGYRYNDSKVLLKDEDEIYSLSHKFWEYFAVNYGYDIAIQIRKYETVNQSMP